MQLLDIHEPGQTPEPHAHDPKIAVGIDLGTTHSLVAVQQGERVEVIKDREGHAIHPSIVAYLASGEVKTGRDAAKEAQPIRSIKRLMGRGKEDITTIAGHLPYPLKAGETHTGGMVRLQVGERTLSPVEISAEILKSLKKQAEAFLQQEVSQAVITVPAYFDDAARTATKDAARLAGLEVLRLVNEPTAAALAYGLDKGAEGLYLVYDLGGGTFDISLLKMQKGVFQVLAAGGDTALGGDDFDQAIAEWCIRSAEFAINAADLPSLLQEARRAKEALSSSDLVTLNASIGGKPVTRTLEKQQFEQLIAPVIERTVQLSTQVLEDAAIEKEAINGVILVGGSTRIPYIQQKLQAFLGKMPLTDVNPDEVVAVGAAIQAAGLTQGGNHLLLDVIPLSLGIELMGGVVERIIERNSPIPTSVAQEFTTYQDGQTAMQFHIVQGEREMAEDCRSLAQLTLRGIPPMKAGVAKVKITFTIDADGLLTVTAEEETTGSRQEVAVKPSYGLEDSEIEHMLRESMRHAREDVARRLLTETKVEAERNILAVEQALKSDGKLLDVAQRNAIEDRLLKLKEALEGPDREAIQQEMQQLESSIDILVDKQMQVHVAERLKGLNLSELEQKVR